MAKVDRKKLLKEPDEFQTISDRAIKWARVHQKTCFLVLGIVVAVIGTVVGIQTYLDYRVHQAADALSPAFQKYSVALNELDNPKVLTEAEKALSAVTQQYGATPSGMQARLALGNLLIEQRKWKEAQKVFQALSDEPDLMAELKPLAQKGYGQSLEGQKEYTKAANAYADAVRLAGPNEAVLFQLDQARVLAAAGDKDAAIALLRKIAADPKDPQSVFTAKQQLVAMNQDPVTD